MQTPAHGCRCRSCGRTYLTDESDMMHCGWKPRSPQWIAARAAGHECEWEEEPFTAKEAPNCLREGGDFTDIPAAETAFDRALEPLRAVEQTACLGCKDRLPSTNWKDGKPYDYCPECGRDSRDEQKASE